MSTTERDAALAAEIEGAMDERLTDAERAELGPDYEAACIRYEQCVEACNEAEAEVEAQGERVVARLLRERDAARAGEGRLRAALRRFAEVFHEGRECGICGCAWDDDGRKHFDGCAAGNALTEADR